MRALDSTERIFLRLERPGYPFDIAEILLLESSPEGPLPFERVRAVFNQRCYRSPALSRVVVPAPLGIGEERWTPAASLDIDQHVHQTTIPEPGDMPALLRTVIEVSREPLERGRPLWQAWYLTGMADGTAALVLRTHHATVDGLGIAQLHRLLFDTEPTPVDVNRQPPPPRGVGGSTHRPKHPANIRNRLMGARVCVQRVSDGWRRTAEPAHGHNAMGGTSSRARRALARTHAPTARAAQVPRPLARRVVRCPPLGPAVANGVEARVPASRGGPPRRAGLRPEDRRSGPCAQPRRLPPC